MRSATSVSDEQESPIIATDAEALELWSKALDPGNLGLAEALAAEIGEHTGEPRALVLERMSTARGDLQRMWREKSPDSRDPGAVARFYREQFLEAYELANWHSGREFGRPPLNYAKAALFARANGLTRVLDFGSGIGSGALCLDAVGCTVDAADVALELLDFVGARFARRGKTIRRLDLMSDTPPLRHYDLIVALDVLEHIPDQLETLRKLESYLRPGGFLWVNLMDDSSHPDLPMHVSSAEGWLRMVRRTGLVPDWPACVDEVQVLRRRTGGRLLNWLASFRDSRQGW